MRMSLATKSMRRPLIMTWARLLTTVRTEEAPGDIEEASGDIEEALDYIMEAPDDIEEAPDNYWDVIEASGISESAEFQCPSNQLKEPR